MTNEQILLAAAQKAKDNGWHKIPCLYHPDEFTEWYKLSGEYIVDKYCESQNKTHINEMLFDHEFAKAFWGEYSDDFIEKQSLSGISPNKDDKWKDKLKELVISEDRIQYLKEFL